jgi:hypothetical protein
VANKRQRQRFVERWQRFERLQGWEGEAAGENEMQQPASANKEGMSRVDNNPGTIQQQQQQ